MYESHNPLDVDIGALKKGEVDLGTSMYCILATPQLLISVVWRSSSKEG
jgi:hypothetical protein